MVFFISKDLDDQANHLDYKVKYLKKITAEFHKLPTFQFCGNGESDAANGYYHQGPVPRCCQLYTDADTDHYQPYYLAEVTVSALCFFCSP